MSTLSRIVSGSKKIQNASNKPRQLVSQLGKSCGSVSLCPRLEPTQRHCGPSRPLREQGRITVVAPGPQCARPCSICHRVPSPFNLFLPQAHLPESKTGRSCGTWQMSHGGPHLGVYLKTFETAWLGRARVLQVTTEPVSRLPTASAGTSPGACRASHSGSLSP